MIPYDKTLYKQRRKIEIMFGRLKDWRIAMRYDLCADTFLCRRRRSRGRAVSPKAEMV
jgi:hypothetical protein